MLENAELEIARRAQLESIYAYLQKMDSRELAMVKAFCRGLMY